MINGAKPMPVYWGYKKPVLNFRCVQQYNIINIQKILYNRKYKIKKKKHTYKNKQ